MTRKIRRKYRPFSTTEDQALLEGVKKYNGQRNVWSLILLDKELGPQFNDRSNAQLRNRFQTMRHTATSSTLPVNDKRLPANYQRLRTSQAMKSTATQDRETSVQPQAQARLSAHSQPQAISNATTQVAQSNQNQQQAHFQQHQKLQKQIQRRQLQQQQQQLAATIAATSNSSQQLQKSQSVCSNQLPEVPRAWGGQAQ